MEGVQHKTLKDLHLYYQVEWATFCCQPFQYIMVRYYLWAVQMSTIQSVSTCLNAFGVDRKKGWQSTYLGWNLQAVTSGEKDRWQTKSALNKATSKTTQVTRFGLVDMSSPLLHIFLIQHISPVHTLVWMLALPGLLVGPTKVLLRTGPSSYIVSHHHYYQHFIV